MFLLILPSLTPLWWEVFLQATVTKVGLSGRKCLAFSPKICIAYPYLLKGKGRRRPPNR